VVEGQYCSHCGQPILEHRRPLWGLLREFFGTIFDFDSRFLSSLRTLLMKPGRLTQHFLKGKRASMLPPIRMYLVLSLLLFFFIEFPIPDADRSNVYVSGQLVGRESEDPDLGRLEIGITATIPWLEPTIESKEEALRQMDPQRLLDAIFRGLEGSFSKALILFIPLLALVLKVLFLRRNRLYYDHVIFSLHFQSFLFLLIIVSWCFSWITPFAFLALLCTPIYLGLAMHRVYGQSWPWTLVKLATLLASYLFVLGLVLGMTFAYLIFRI
jgi:hypothetical protein